MASVDWKPCQGGLVSWLGKLSHLEEGGARVGLLSSNTALEITDCCVPSNQPSEDAHF